MQRRRSFKRSESLLESSGNGTENNGIAPARKSCLWRRYRATGGTCIIEALVCCSPTRIRPTRALSSPHSPFLGERRRATKIWGDTTWSGPETWSAAPWVCWPREIPRLPFAGSSILPQASRGMEVSRKTSGSKGSRTGAASSLTKWHSPFYLPGAYAVKTPFETSILTRW